MELRSGFCFQATEYLQTRNGKLPFPSDNSLTYSFCFSYSAYKLFKPQLLHHET